MKKKIFIWVAHPKAGSLSEGLADSYQRGAEESGAEVRRMDLHTMQFDRNDDDIGFGSSELEPDLKAWQDNINWADHIMIVHPYWWGAMPTKAKAVIDQAFRSGFAYRYKARGVAWDKLLTGKTGDGIITSDTPPLIDTLLYWRPGRRVLKTQLFDFTGIKPKNIIQLGSVKMATEEKIKGWLGRVQKMGAKAAA